VTAAVARDLRAFGLIDDRANNLSGLKDHLIEALVIERFRADAGMAGDSKNVHASIISLNVTHLNTLFPAVWTIAAFNGVGVGKRPTAHSALAFMIHLEAVMYAELVAELMRPQPVESLVGLKLLSIVWACLREAEAAIGPYGAEVEPGILAGGQGSYEPPTIPAFLDLVRKVLAGLL